MQHLPERKKIRLPHNTYKQGNAFSITITTSGRYPWFQLYPNLAVKFIQLCIEEAEKREASLFAWCVMPDHVHLLLTPLYSWNLSKILQGIKGYTSREINKLLNRKGSFWQDERADKIL